MALGPASGLSSVLYFFLNLGVARWDQLCRGKQEEGHYPNLNPPKPHSNQPPYTLLTLSPCWGQDPHCPQYDSTPNNPLSSELELQVLHWKPPRASGYF